MTKKDETKALVCQMINNGYTPEEIRAELRISRRTYYYHLRELRAGGCLQPSGTGQKAVFSEQALQTIWDNVAERKAGNKVALAKQLGTTRQTLNNWEQAGTGLNDLTQRCRIFKALGYSDNKIAARVYTDPEKVRELTRNLCSLPEIVLSLQAYTEAYEYSANFNEKHIVRRTKLKRALDTIRDVADLSKESDGF